MNETRAKFLTFQISNKQANKQTNKPTNKQRNKQTNKETNNREMKKKKHVCVEDRSKT